jgi:hypothetical protein
MLSGDSSSQSDEEIIANPMHAHQEDEVDEDEEDVDEEDEDEDDEEGDENDDDDEPMEHVGADLEIIENDDYDQEDEEELDDMPHPQWGHPGGRLGGANAANDIIAVNPDGGQQQGHPWRIAHQYGYRPRDRPG